MGRTVRHSHRLVLVGLAVAISCSSALAWPAKQSARLAAEAQTIAAAGELEVAFSPSGGAETLVIKLIDSARTELRVLAYTFTSARITAALIRARKRGVDVQLVADRKNNTTDDKSGKSRAALSALANAGVDVRLISAYAIHHDKVIVADRSSVELGSFNFSEAAETRNSENVLVHWRNPALAAAYLAHFERNQRQAQPLQQGY